MNALIQHLSLLGKILGVLLRRNTNDVKELFPQQTSSAQYPKNDDREGWRDYWVQMGQPWRTELEIDAKRQQYLTERRTIIPDVKRGIYPFKDVKLSRADVEWLLVTHENGRGPVDWTDEKQRTRRGLDLRGADLRQVDLHHLPLSRIRGGLDFQQWIHATEEQRNIAVVHMEHASLKWAHLEGAYLRGAHLEGVSFFRAFLHDAHLDKAHLENSSFNEAHLEIVVLTGAILYDERHVGPHVVDAYWGITNFKVTQKVKTVKSGLLRCNLLSLFQSKSLPGYDTQGIDAHAPHCKSVSSRSSLLVLHGEWHSLSNTPPHI